jgi:AcrR family transcriptional regulator
MAVIVRRVKAPPRKPGERANLTLTKIVDVALAVLDDHGLENFSARAVAKRLSVSPAAIYAHVEGGLSGLKTQVARVTLSNVARPYRPKDTPASYYLDLALRLLKAVRGKQALAQLVSFELAADYLVCPQFTERLFSVLAHKSPSGLPAAQRLDLAMATLVGMAMIEAGTHRNAITATLSRDFKRRLKTLALDEAATLTEHSDDLMMQIRRRLLTEESHLRRTANRYVAPVIAALKLDVEARGSPN